MGLNYTAPLESVTAFRLGQRQGAFAGVIFSVGSYVVYKATKAILHERYENQTSENQK
jgi:hypothetical protein